MKQKNVKILKLRKKLWKLGSFQFTHVVTRKQKRKKLNKKTN